MSKKIAIIRARGKVGVNKDINTTMDLLKLNRVNHCVIVDDSPHYMGMLAKCKDYITWGEIDKITFQALLKKRGLVSGNKKVSDENFKKYGFNSIDDFSEKFMNSECNLKTIKEMKPIFRLHPPRGGYKHIKRQYPHGALGDRKEKINELIKKMI